MIGTLNALFAAVVAFAGGHFLLSSQVLRPALRRRLGEQGFRIAYAIAVGAAFVWVLLAYRDAPYLEVWPPQAALAWVPVVVMPVAFFLIVAGVTTRSPTAVGGESVVESGAHDLTPGILRITRHPFLWGAALWAASHLVANGDAASLVLTGGILVLALGGMRHIDQRREADLGAAWGPIALTTSAIPFVAIAQNRTSFDWAGIGWWRLLLAIVLYFVFLHLHGDIVGVDALPFSLSVD